MQRHAHFSLYSLLLLALSACADEETADPSPPADTAIDAGSDTGSDVSSDVEALDVEPEVAAPRATPPTTTIYVAREFNFSRELPGGIVEGFDLDGAVSNGSDGTGCNQPDYTNAAGETGIDNQFASLLPVIESAGGAALPTLIQSAINEGDLLIVAVFSGVDDWLNDDDVTVTIGRAIGDPIVGADNTLQPWQTLTLDVNESVTRITGSRIVDGVLTGGTLSLPLPVFVFTFRFDVTLHGALIRAEMTETGPSVLMTGGAVTLENILDIARNPGIQDRIPAALEQLGPLISDLSVTSNCDSLSVAASLTLMPVYLFNPPAE
jgi:hypothetical protein